MFYERPYVKLLHVYFWVERLDIVWIRPTSATVSIDAYHVCSPLQNQKVCFSSSYWIPILHPQFLQNKRIAMSELRYSASVESLVMTKLERDTPMKSLTVEPTVLRHAVQWQMSSCTTGFWKWNTIPSQWHPPDTSSSLVCLCVWAIGHGLHSPSRWLDRLRLRVTGYGPYEFNINWF